MGRTRLPQLVSARTRQNQTKNVLEPHKSHPVPRNFRSSVWVSPSFRSVKNLMYTTAADCRAYLSTDNWHIALLVLL